MRSAEEELDFVLGNLARELVRIGYVAWKSENSDGWIPGPHEVDEFAHIMLNIGGHGIESFSRMSNALRDALGLEPNLNSSNGPTQPPLNKAIRIVLGQDMALDDSAFVRAVQFDDYSVGFQNFINGTWSDCPSPPPNLLNLQAVRFAQSFDRYAFRRMLAGELSAPRGEVILGPCLISGTPYRTLRLDDWSISVEIWTGNDRKPNELPLTAFRDKQESFLNADLLEGLGIPSEW